MHHSYIDHLVHALPQKLRNTDDYDPGVYVVCYYNDGSERVFKWWGVMADGEWERHIDTRYAINLIMLEVLLFASQNRCYILDCKSIDKDV